MTNNKYIKYIDANAVGKDYIVGDIHGCKDAVMRLLDYVKFDSIVDRLISTGDLIDRGPDSIGALALLDHDWFHAVKGNHEAMLVKAITKRPDPTTDPYYQTANDTLWHRNGGDWARDLDPQYLKQTALKLNKLPHVLVVGKGTPSRFHVWHGEFYLFSDNHGPLTDEFIDNQGNEFIDNLVMQSAWGHNDDYDMLLWGRSMIMFELPSRRHLDDDPMQTDRLGIVEQPLPPIQQCSVAYVGHTPTTKPVKFECQWYLDQGAVFGMLKQDNPQHLTSSLTMFCHQTNMIYQLRTQTNEFFQFSADDTTKTLHANK